MMTMSASAADLSRGSAAQLQEWGPQSAIGRNFEEAHPTTPKLNDQRVGTSARFRRGLARELERRIASLEYELSLKPDAPLSNSAARGAIGHDLRVLRAQLCEVAGTLRPANAEPHFFGSV